MYLNPKIKKWIKPLLSKQENIILKKHVRMDILMGTLMLKDYQLLYWKYGIKPEDAVLILEKLRIYLGLGELIYLAFLEEPELYNLKRIG